MFGFKTSSTNAVLQENGWNETLISQHLVTKIRIDRVYSPVGTGIQHLYKNIFCSMCNTNYYGMYTETCATSCTKNITRQPSLHPPLSLIISFRTELNNSKESLMNHLNCCTGSAWTSPDGKCLPVQCSPGKAFSK